MKDEDGLVLKENRGNSNINPLHSKILLAILICALLADMLLGTFSDFWQQEQNPTTIRGFSPPFQPLNPVVIFSALSVIILGIGQYELSTFVKNLSKGVRQKFSSFRIMYVILAISQYILILLFAVLIFQIVSSTKFYTSLVVAIVGIGTIPAGIMLAFLCFKFFTWYRLNIARPTSGVVVQLKTIPDRHNNSDDDEDANDISRKKTRKDKKKKNGSSRNFILLFLGFAAITGSIAAIVGNIVIMDVIVNEKPVIIDPLTSVSFVSTSRQPILNSAFYFSLVLPLVLSFFFEWAGIVLIIRQFAKRVFSTNFLFLTIVFLPIVLFVAGISSTIIVEPSSKFSYYSQDAIFSRVLATVGAAAGYFIMGFGYFLVARQIGKIKNNLQSFAASTVASYLTTSAFGVIMISIAFQSPAINATYPPWGLASHSFLGIASFIFSLGFYSSAISVSENIRLRKEIVKTAVDESKLLDSIGNAEMVQEMQRRILSIANKHSDVMTEETGIQPSLSEDDMKLYLDEVLEEIKRSRKAE